MSSKQRELYEFGGFLLDVEEHSLTQGEVLANTHLTETAFRALVIFVRNNGRLLTKQELIDQIWPDSFVEENNLDKCVHAIRHALGETPGEHRFIETVRKHGYRFVARVNRLEGTKEERRGQRGSEFLEDPMPADAGHQPVISTVRTESGAFVVSARWPRETDEELVTDARNGHKNSSFTESPQAQETEQASTSINRSLVSVAGVGVLCVAALSAMIYFPVGSQPKRETNNEEANRFYLLAMNLSEERGAQNVMKALEYLDQAVTLDPNYARAWAGKALIHRDLVAIDDSGQHEHYQKSMEAIGKALTIDPNLSEAYSALCQNKNRYEYDVSGAESACKRALELDSNSPIAHKTYANFLYSRGRFDEAISEIKTAMELQPVSYRNQQMLALTLYYARRYGEAEDQFKRLIELNPNHGYIYGRLVRVLEDQGKEPEAFEYLVKMLTVQKVDAQKLERFKTAYQTSGWRGVVIEQIKSAESDAAPNYFQLACLYAKSGSPDKAFEYLEKAYEQRSFQIAVLQVEPQLDSLRGDARYAELLTRVYGH